MTDRSGVPWWVRASVGAVVAALTLMGCSGSGEPDPVPPSPSATSGTTAITPSPTQEATPEPSPESSPEPSQSGAVEGLPPLPEAAKENTPEGAEAFIRYYFDVANYAHTAPQAGLIPSLGDAGCESCKAMEEQIMGLVSRDEKASLGPYEIETMSRIGGGAAGVTRFQVVLTQPDNQLLTAEGELVQDAPGRTLSGEMGAIWTGRKWLFYDSALQ